MKLMKGLNKKQVKRVCYCEVSCLVRNTNRNFDAFIKMNTLPAKVLNQVSKSKDLAL